MLYIFLDRTLYFGRQHVYIISTENQEGQKRRGGISANKKREVIYAYEEEKHAPGN